MDTRFVVMTDTHFTAPGTGKDECYWNRVLRSRSSEIADSLVSTVKSLSPDFIIHCGDFTDASDMASFRFGKKVMDRMGSPYFMVLGNHDTWTEGIRESIAPLFEHGPGARFYYTRRLGGIRFLFLDCAYWIRKDGVESEGLDWDLYEKGIYADIGPTYDQLVWLERELDLDQKTPTVIVTHAPMHTKPTFSIGTLPEGKIPEGDPAKWNPAPRTEFVDGDIRVAGNFFIHDEAVKDMVDHAPNVMAVFAGHQHFADITRDRNTVHCLTGSLVEYPFEMRLVRVCDGVLSISPIELDAPRFKRDSLIVEWGNQWVAGIDTDRHFSMTIDLSAAPEVG